jgi:hypothetical protein
MRDDDKRKLAEIEQQLVEEDPKLAAKLTAGKSAASPTARFIARMFATYLAGLMIVVGGLAISSDILIVLGVAITTTFPIEVAYRSWRDRSSRSEATPPAVTDADVS